MQQQDYFELTTDPSGIAHLRLNRPERMNTMAPSFFPALRDAVRGLADAGQARVPSGSAHCRQCRGRPSSVLRVRMVSAARPPEGAGASPRGAVNEVSVGAACKRV